MSGITHIEDLSPSKFASFIDELGSAHLTEKLDGSNLDLGVDEKGFFTSREGKRPGTPRFYSLSDYPVISAYNGFRSLHQALETKRDVIESTLKDGDLLEMEVLFGDQPNTVEYSNKDSHAIILRTIDGSEDRTKKLVSALSAPIKVKSQVVVSTDGDTIEDESITVVWRVSANKPLKLEDYDISEAYSLNDALKTFLSEKNKIIPGRTNGQVAEMKLTDVSTAMRSKVKQERALLNEIIMNTYKLPIKNILIDELVDKVPGVIGLSGDLGVEGVVATLKDGTQVKIVDKDTFTAANSFNSSLRGLISGKTPVGDGIFSKARKDIALVFGNPDLASPTKLKKLLAAHSSIGDAAKALTKGVDGKSAIKKVETIITKALATADKVTNDFVKSSKDMSIRLADGSVHGVSDGVKERTLTWFAESKKTMRDVLSAVKSAKTASDLFKAVYSRQLETAFSGESEVAENKGFSIIKSFIDEDDGGGGDAAPPATPADSTAVTTSSNIAAYPQRLFGGKVVKRRIRNWKAPKRWKIPTVEKVEEGSQFATDVDDSARGSTDVEFKQLRNNVNMSGLVTAGDVNRYLSKAHELNDEVDTITFGMELDDDKIVKVYVNAEDADGFEEFLSELLGKIDDIEEVINQASDKYDIVDVEWPAGLDTDTEDNTDSSESMDDAEADIDREVFGYDDASSFDDAPEEEEPPSTGKFSNLLALIDKTIDDINESTARSSTLKEDTVYTVKGLNVLAQLLEQVGFDLDANKSFTMQARQLQSAVPKGILALKQSTVISRLSVANEAVAQAIAEISTTTTQESQGWNVSKVELEGDEIITLTGYGAKIQLNHLAASKLLIAAASGNTATVKDIEDNLHVFTPSEEGGELDGFPIDQATLDYIEG
jgi:hypothetical protein